MDVQSRERKITILGLRMTALKFTCSLGINRKVRVHITKSMTKQKLENNADHTLPGSALSQSRLNDAVESTYPYYSLTLPPSPNKDAPQQDDQHQLHPQQQMETMSPSVPLPLVIPVGDAQPLDVFYPFFDPQMISLFPNGEMSDLSHFDTNPSGLNYFEIEGWNKADSLIAYSGVGDSMVEGNR
jgi:hypothetical protein